MPEESQTAYHELSRVTNDDLYARISQNPWDETLFITLQEKGRHEEENLQERVRKVVPRARGQKERKLLPKRLLNFVTLDGYIGMVNKMRAAATLEEKYRLLAEEAPLDSRYADMYKKYKKLVWYDFIQGEVYDLHPPQIYPDILGGSYPDSVYEALGHVLKRKGREYLHLGVDLGSGTGEVSRIMAVNFPKVMAIDRFQFLHDIAIEREQEKGVISIDHVVGDVIEGIPLADNSADLIVSNGLTAFIPKDKLALFTRELARVLRKNGTYLEPEVKNEGMSAKAIKDEFSVNAKSLLAYMIGELVTSPDKGLTGAYPHSGGDIAKAFTQAGFGARVFSSVKNSCVTGIDIVEYTKK